MAPQLTISRIASDTLISSMMHSSRGISIRNPLVGFGVVGLREGCRVRAILADGAADMDVRGVREAPVGKNGRRELLPLVTAESVADTEQLNGERSEP